MKTKNFMLAVFAMALMLFAIPVNATNQEIPVQSNDDSDNAQLSMKVTMAVGDTVKVFGKELTLERIGRATADSDKAMIAMDRNKMVVVGVDGVKGEIYTVQPKVVNGLYIRLVAVRVLTSASAADAPVDLIVSLSPIAVSDSEDDVDEDSADRVEPEDVFLMKNNHGMELRLLQLQKKVNRNIIFGKSIITEIEAQEYNVSTTNLKNIVSKMKVLDEQIDDELAQDPVDVSTEEFVQMKAKAINLTFQFKKELYTILTPEQLNEVRKALREKYSERDEKTDKIDEKIKKSVENFNKEKAIEILEKLNVKNDELINKLEEGTITPEQLREELKNMYKNMNEDRKQIFANSVSAEKSEEWRVRSEVEARNRGLNGSEASEILKDDSLTWEEKQAKIRVLASEREGQNPRVAEGNGNGAGSGNGNSN